MKAGRLFGLLALGLFGGCATLPVTPLVMQQAVVTPVAFSADYQWTADSPPPGYEQAPAMLHLAGRHGQVVRVVGLTFFGATVFDFILQRDPVTDRLKGVSRIGAGTETEALAERLVRRAFFGQEVRPKVRIIKQEPAPEGLPAGLTFATDGQKVEWRLQQAQSGPQPDEDFQYPGPSGE
jgi:hypothetical protein